MRLLPVLSALTILGFANSTVAAKQSDADQLRLSAPQPPAVPLLDDEGATQLPSELLTQPPALAPQPAGEPVFAPPPAPTTAACTRLRRHRRHRPRVTPPGAYYGYYNFYNDPFPVDYWSPNLPYYDPQYGYNSFRPLPPKSRHYRGPANPHNTGWGISY